MILVEKTCLLLEPGFVSLFPFISKERNMYRGDKYTRVCTFFE